VPVVPQQFSISSDYFNIYKEHSESASLDILYRNTEITSLFHFNNTSLSINLGNTNSYLSWKTNQINLQNNIELKQNYSSISLYSTFNNIFIDSKVTLNNYQQRLLFDYSFRMGLISLRKNNMEFDLAFRKTSVPLSWNFSYQTAGFNINTGQSYYLTSINSSISANDLRFGLFYEKNISLKENSSETYSVDAKPIYDNIRFEIKNRSDHFPISFDVSRTSLTMKTHLLMNDLQFSSINISELSLFRINSDIQFNEFIIPLRYSVSYNFFNGNISGNAETWPFADIIQSMIVNRINFKAFGSVKMIESSLTSKIIYKYLVIKPLIDLYYINPEFTIQNWQPVFLAFGIKDYNESNDGINYLFLGRAGGSADIDVGIAVITLNINQFFPLFIKKDIHQNVHSSSSVSSISTSSTEKISGGTFVSLSLTRSF
jgi:hypothetical protein